MTNRLPILYSFRRCPYAMRARLGLAYAEIRCTLREVVLRDKPPEMIALSPKATVPVLHLPDGQVIDESYDIVRWALEQHDPANWRTGLPEAGTWVVENDNVFKKALDHYKYASRFPEHPPEFYRAQGAVFLEKLEKELLKNAFIAGPRQTVVDILLFPFIRQFAHVDRNWFSTAPYPRLQHWLTCHKDSALFERSMVKYPPWQSGDRPVYFPD